MDNFNIYPKTNIFFGTNQMEPFFNFIQKENYKNILFAYGHGNIKKNGLYDLVIIQLKRIGVKVTELSGIDPNPRLSTVQQGIDICKEEKIDFILGVGGGSTIDCIKAIAVGAMFTNNEDIWDMMYYLKPIEKALPTGNILTLSATGSETNGGFVITNEFTTEKISHRSHLCVPAVTLLDPTNTYSVSSYQTAAGSADILSHILEQYFNSERDAFVTDRILEGLAKTVLKYAPIAFKHPGNYEARANLMWCGTMALNNISGAGRSFEGSVHLIEHALSAYNDVTHGAGLAIVYPHYFDYILSGQNVHRFNQFFENVFHLQLGEDRLKHAKQGIIMLSDFFSSLDLPSKLREVGIEKENLAKIAQGALQARNIEEYGSLRLLKKDDIFNIYQLAY